MPEQEITLEEFIAFMKDKLARYEKEARKYPIGNNNKSGLSYWLDSFEFFE